MNRKQRRIKKAHGNDEDTIRFNNVPYTLIEANELAIHNFNQKNFRAAVDIYQLIIAKLPGHAELHNNLGCALRKAGRNQEALASFDKVLVLQPNNALVYNNKGAILQELNRHGEALANYDKAIALKPDYAEAHVNRGLTLQETGQFAEALIACDKAIAISPNSEKAHNIRALALQGLKRYEEALASCDKALALNPSHVESMHNRGDILMNIGKMQEAEHLFQKALDLKPDFPYPLFCIAQMRKYEDTSHPDYAHVQSLLAKANLPLGDKELLYYTLGKIYDDCKRYDEAFECFQQANQIRNGKVSYMPDQLTGFFNDLIDVFSKEFLAQSFSFEPDSRVPIFIVGMPRSGTTLMASILSNHPSIDSAGEMTTIRSFTTQLPSLLGTGIPYPQGVQYIAPAIASRLITAYETQLRREASGNTPYIIDKHPLNFTNLGFISMLFPHATVIHCTRHPLDTALSNYFQRFTLDYNYSFDLKNIDHFYGQYARLMEHWRKTLPKKMIEISYEDMILNTQQAVCTVLDALGLEWDERCLSPHTNHRAIETASKWQVRQPIYRQSLERWRHYQKHLTPLKKMLQLQKV